MSDLISRQDVIEKINERARETFSLAPGYEYYLGALHDVSYDLEQMPTIDAVPVKRGKWVKAGQSFVNPNRFRNYCCSVCGYDIEKTKYNYCPNCGAKMDGGKDDV